MADEGQGQERTEDATPKRLREARKKGQVARSRDLTTIIVLIGAFAIIAFMRGFMVEEFKSMMQSTFDVAARRDLNLELLFLHGVNTFWSFVRISAPFLLAILLVALAVGFLQVGPIFSAEPLKPQMKRMNAIENLKNMFKITTFVELLKNIAKVSLIFLLAYFVISDSLREVVLTTSATPETSSKIAAGIVVTFLLRVFAIFSIIAIVDMMVQRWHYRKQLRMTKEEVKREYKQDEGDPLIKGERRRFHQELAMSDVKQAVGMSDVVVTNPTELAVALKYDDKEMPAPMIMAKGQRLFAQAIREYAKEQGIPIVQNVPLAWTLIELDVGDDIPEDIYAAVAEILVYVYRLKEKGN
ncbi:MAG: EscU/YscU/HrcU family type III secretion system export apparatus switch protein [Deltaproteobacteria bacterium]|nr:EscU/YscU/HrcU family type III secretion system export apparatus switch protein [Deltaproteobacteria bacterium]